MTCFKIVYYTEKLNEKEYYKTLCKLKSNANLIHTITLSNGHDITFMSSKPRYVLTDHSGLPIYRDEGSVLNTYWCKTFVRSTENMIVSRFGLPYFMHIFEDQPYCDYETFVNSYDFTDVVTLSVDNEKMNTNFNIKDNTIKFNDKDKYKSLINGKITGEDLGLNVLDVNQTVDPLMYFDDSSVVVDGIINLNIASIQVAQVNI